MHKIKFFLILLIALLIVPSLSVKAATTSFYEGEYIQGIWMNKYNPANNTTYYQTARFFRETGTNDFAYCIQPFNFFNENATYESTVNQAAISNLQREKVALIAHFGYGYKNHTDPKWYAITQFMIWKESDHSGQYYFTDSLNGNKITAYTSEMNEINNLINNYNKLPSLANKTYDIVENNTLEIVDTNNVLNNYQTNSDLIKIDNNKIIMNNPQEGNYEISLIREEKYYNKPHIFWKSSTSQNLIETGDLDKKEIKFNINVQKTSINLTKVDADTKDTKSQGKASLDGALYNLYDESNNFIDTLEIINNTATIENLNYGKYYLKEEKAGVGYNLDTNTYEIILSKETPNIDKQLENEIIKAKVTINKQYGDKNNMQNEKNIDFNLYDSNNNLYKTLTTDKNGIIQIELPYDTYRLEQLNTTSGYSKIEPLTIDINNNDDINLKLKDYHIPVPDTHTDNILTIIIKLILSILC